MMGSLARREHRPLWGALALVTAAVVGFSLWAASNARAEATRASAADAQFTAQTELVPLLQVRDLTTPVTGERASELADKIDRTILSVSAVDDVRIFSSLGRILYAADPRFIGTRPSYLRNLTFEVASGSSQSLEREGLLQTYVPIWMTPGGDVAVAELSQPVGPIVAEATAGWLQIAMVAGALLLACIAMVVITSRAVATRSVPVQLFASATARRPTHGMSSTVGAPLYEQPGFRDLEEQRRESERRAIAVEENFRAVKARLKETQQQVKDLEGKLAMNETQNTTSDGDLHVLRDQLRDTSERLHKAELDNNALRERMSLRQQELDEGRRILSEVRRETEADQLRARLNVADERVEEMEREIERLAAELHTNTSLHTTRSPAAHRGFDQDDLEIEEEDDLFEHPVIIRNATGQSTQSQRVR
jgi:hypothetical protein